MAIHIFDKDFYIDLIFIRLQKLFIYDKLALVPIVKSVLLLWLSNTLITKVSPTQPLTIIWQRSSIYFNDKYSTVNFIIILKTYMYFKLLTI